MPSFSRVFFIAAAVFVCAAWVARDLRADVKLPAVLSDHMVLQQGIAAPVWGTAEPGEKVTVSFAGQTEAATADSAGKWSIKLAALPASATPSELTVKGNNTITLRDILVGEVWVCSGQSNMGFNTGSAINATKEIAEADYPEIRLFLVPPTAKDQPQADTRASWAACSAQTVGNFTAVGYFFGRDLFKSLGVPIGLIQSAWGGTVAEAWASPDALKSDPDFAPILDRAPKAKAGDPNVASRLYNGMITPLVPFAIKGAIWYQGESNAARAYQYRKLLPAMIKSWRDAWGEGDFDFLIVSLANFDKPPAEPGDSDWAELREAQTMTAAMPHNGQALAIDLADADNPSNIHPRNKQDVGLRLSLIAEANVYGKHDVVYSGPEYDSMKEENGKVRLTFKQSNGGLVAKGGEPLKGFQVAGEDKKWHWADAAIDGESVIVSSAEVPHPVAVRYAWARNPVANLYNKAGLPAVPFRTDDWAGMTVNNR
jgi:sialate O-acetylesterase